MTEDLVQWKQVKGLERSKLDQLVEESLKAKAVVEAAEQVLKAINDKILNSLVTANVKSVAVDDVRVTFVPGRPSERLNKKKLFTRLLELGVKEKVVTKAFKGSTTKGDDTEPYVLVTPPKDEGGQKGASK